MLLDIQDLLQFLHDHGSVSGIQRVQLGILAAVLDGKAGPLGDGCVAVFPVLEDGTLWAPPAGALRAIVAHCTGHGLNPALARRLVREAADAGSCSSPPRAGAALHRARRLLVLRRRAALLPGAAARRACGPAC